MATFLLSLLSLSYLTIFGAVPQSFSAHLLLFTALTEAVSLLTEDAIAIAAVPLALTIIIALVDVTRRNLARAFPLLLAVTALIAIPSVPLASVASAVYLLLLLLRKERTSLFTALISALLLAGKIGEIYYLRHSSCLFLSAALLLLALALNWKKKSLH